MDLVLEKIASWVLFSLYMVVHVASICDMLSEVWGRINSEMFSTSEFTATWMEVDSRYGVTSFRGKAAKHTGARCISEA